MRIVIGDVHGCYKTLRKMLENRLKIGLQDKVFIVGDLIDRGPGSKQVIEFILNLREQGFHIKVLKGNHEEMLIDTYLNQTENNFLLWMMNGAETTFDSYHIESYKYEGVAAINHIPEKHLSFMRSLPYYIESENFYLVHAGFDFQNDDPFQDISTMVWSREMTYESRQTGGKMIIHGHTPIPAGQAKEFFINSGKIEVNVDTGCVYKDRHPGMGYLTAFDIDTFQFYFEENIDF